MRRLLFRGMLYVKRNFLAGRDYTQLQHSIRQATAHVLRWVSESADQRNHGTTSQIPLASWRTEPNASPRK